MGNVKTPELEKISRVMSDSQKIGEFLEWLDSQEIILAQWEDSECELCGEEAPTLVYIKMNREKLLANYFCIDLVKAETERQAILDDIRAKNAESKP